MGEWSDLEAELEAWRCRGRRATFWWRDDDAVEATPALERLLGLADGSGADEEAELAGDIGENGPRQHYMRATAAPGPNGVRRVSPVRSQDSSLLAPLASADCLIIRPPHAPAARKGETVPVLPLDF